ncbi:recombinase family protein [Paenibacillus sp. FSL E2-0201]|uniref:recombinase family protein n=1 Tax=Paenibacillus sp. FSL E2-0201 TaxID=2954726 RepID=UPI0030DD0BD3
MSGNQRKNEACNLHVAVYCRFSTDEQTREAVSLDKQQERLKSLYRSMGWMVQVQLFTADGYLAKKIDRLELKRLLNLDHEVI